MAPVPPRIYFKTLLPGIQGPPWLGFHRLSFQAHLSPLSLVLLFLLSPLSISVPLPVPAPLPEEWSLYFLCFAQILDRFATHQWVGPKSPPFCIPRSRLRAWPVAELPFFCGLQLHWSVLPVSQVFVSPPAGLECRNHSYSFLPSPSKCLTNNKCLINVVDLIPVLKGRKLVIVCCPLRARKTQYRSG